MYTFTATYVEMHNIWLCRIYSNFVHFTAHSLFVYFVSKYIHPVIPTFRYLSVITLCAVCVKGMNECVCVCVCVCACVCVCVHARTTKNVRLYTHILVIKYTNSGVPQDTCMHTYVHALSTDISGLCCTELYTNFSMANAC